MVMVERTGVQLSLEILDVWQPAFMTDDDPDRPGARLDALFERPSQGHEAFIIDLDLRLRFPAMELLIIRPRKEGARCEPPYIDVSGRA